LEVIDLSVFDEIKADLAADIAKLKEEGNRHSVLLLLTDIMQEGSEMLISSEDDSVIEAAYGVKPESGKIWLDGVLSRKKQVVPPLQDAFS
jgi:manganese-dependent inorganic pyrophosphatase